MGFDLVVIGGGPGGYAAAIRAAKLGLKTACIEKRDTLGGTCLNVGCIPSKALLQSTGLYAFTQVQGTALGIEGTLNYNFATMMQRKEAVVKSLTSGIPHQFEKTGVEWIKGTAQFINGSTIRIEEEKREIESKYILLASGSEAIPLPFLPFDEKKVLSSTGALSLNQVPKKMVIIGAGVIGVEIASIYSRLGTQVTLVEMLDRIGGNLDPTLHQHFLTSLTKQGMDFHLSAKVLGGEVKKNTVSLDVEEKGKRSRFEADCVLVAVGRKPFTSQLGLEAAGVKLSPKGFIMVDGQFKTSTPNIFAIGDVIEGPMLAHRAYQEAACISDHLAGKSFSVDYISIPNIIYTHPEVATVGLTEEEAKQMGLNTFNGTCYMKANPRARCAGDTEGLVKVIGDKASGKLLGMHILAGNASEMIAEGVLALHNRMSVDALAATCHGHPTFSEAIQEACLIALGQSPHY